MNVPAAVYRIREVAVCLGVSTRTVQRLLHLGDLDRIKIGRATRIPTASVEKFMSRGGTKS